MSAKGPHGKSQDCISQERKLLHSQQPKALCLQAESTVLEGNKACTGTACNRAAHLQLPSSPCAEQELVDATPASWLGDSVVDGGVAGGGGGEGGGGGGDRL